MVSRAPLLLSFQMRVRAWLPPISRLASLLRSLVTPEATLYIREACESEMTCQIEGEIEPVTLYHYTEAKDAYKIVKSGVFLASNALGDECCNLSLTKDNGPIGQEAWIEFLWRGDELHSSGWETTGEYQGAVRIKEYKCDVLIHQSQRSILLPGTRRGLSVVRVTLDPSKILVTMPYSEISAHKRSLWQKFLSIVKGKNYGIEIGEEDFVKLIEARNGKPILIEMRSTADE